MRKFANVILFGCLMFVVITDSCHGQQQMTEEAARAEKVKAADSEEDAAAEYTTAVNEKSNAEIAGNYFETELTFLTDAIAGGMYEITDWQAYWDSGAVAITAGLNLSTGNDLLDEGNGIFISADSYFSSGNTQLELDNWNSAYLQFKDADTDYEVAEFKFESAIDKYASAEADFYVATSLLWDSVSMTLP